MVFSSPVFLFLFLPAVLGVYFLPRMIAPRRGAGTQLRNVLLLLASLFFYAWGETFYVVLMLASITANYALGLAVDRHRGKAVGKVLTGLAVALNLAALATFKYANFLVDNVNSILGGLGLTPIELAPVHLPIGISFFTFQAMSYVLDVYRGEAPVQRNPVNIALYISLFPQLIAGPIVRYHDVAAQLIRRVVDVEGFAYGVRRFVIGLGKKMLLANVVGRVADDVFALPSDQVDAPIAWVGLVAYSLQIYFDFSGYSDMAIGLGRMLGFRFLENFNYPYISQSITEFWRRWHISLSSWFRDYLYIPLGGNRKGSARTYLHLVTVFFLCGLWHGAQWNFVVWGLFHGVFLVIERMGLSAVLARLWRPLRHAYVLAVVVCGWVLFRAETLTDALAYLRAMVGLGAEELRVLSATAFLTNEVILALTVGVVAATPVAPWLAGKARRWSESLGAGPLGAPPAALAGQLALLLGLGAIFLASVLRLAAGTHNPFIYFRF